MDQRSAQCKLQHTGEILTVSYYRQPGYWHACICTDMKQCVQCRSTCSLAHPASKLSIKLLSLLSFHLLWHHVNAGRAHQPIDMIAVHKQDRLSKNCRNRQLVSKWQKQLLTFTWQWLMTAEQKHGKQPLLIRTRLWSKRFGWQAYSTPEAISGLTTNWSRHCKSALLRKACLMAGWYLLAHFSFRKC